jgi:hypothetical protein
MHIICPHCQHPIARDEVITPEQLLYPACGATFRLARGKTGPWTPPEGQRPHGPSLIGQTISHYRSLVKLRGDGRGGAF